EGLDDLIHADTDRQRRQALRQLKGLLGDRARDWRAQIIEASALIEAGIDFSDEGDVPAELIAPALAKVKVLLTEIEEVLAGQGVFQISASRGDGLPELIAALVGFAQNYFGGSEGGLIGRTRQRKLLQETAASLRRCVQVVGQGEELAAEELRMAAHTLGRLL